MLNPGIELRNYRVGSSIGEGAFGWVFLAEHLGTGNPVALKVMRSENDPTFKARFVQEAEILLTLRHPNLVQAYEYFEWQNTVILAEEYFGESLEEIISKKTGPIPHRRAIGIFSQVLAALQYAHDKGVLHRDIKPSNVLVGPGDVTKLTDFGIAKVSGAESWTQTGFAMGTYAYMSPEAVKGESQSNQSDIYSLGVTLFEMLTGRLPFEAETIYAMGDLHINQLPPKPSEFYPHVPQNIEEVVLTALEKEEVNRFSSCEEFSKALLDEDWSRPEPYAEPEEEEDDFSSTNYDDDDDDDDLLDDEVQDAGWQTTSGEHETTEPFFDRAGVKSLSAIICGLIGMGIGAIPGGVAAIPGAIIGGLIGYAAPGLGIFLLVGIGIIFFLFLSNM